MPPDFDLFYPWWNFHSRQAARKGLLVNMRVSQNPRRQDHPVERWRVMFQDVVNQLDEAEGKGTVASDAEDRTQRQTELAAGEPSLELKVESRNVALAYRNLESCEVSYYVMDMDGENVSPKRMAHIVRRFLELYAEDTRQDQDVAHR